MTAEGAENHESPQELIARLNSDFSKFHESFSEQFHLRIPKGVIRRVDDYRDGYFDYLKDSIYKSNICYLLQTVDFQLWLYKVFRPALSVENAYFYQLMVSLGIVAEATANALLLDPLIEADQGDRSLGQVPEKHAHLRDTIIFQSFDSNIRLLSELGVLPTALVQQFQDIRVNIRNTVHIQGWEGRLYQQLTFAVFQQRLEQFRSLLTSLKQDVSLQHDALTLSKKLFGGELESGRRYHGSVALFRAKGGFGFIQSEELERQVYFHISEARSIAEEDLPDCSVTFEVRRGKRGLEAHNIQVGT